MLAAVPRLAHASFTDIIELDPKDPTHHTVNAKSTPKKSGPTTATYIHDDLTVNFTSPDVAQIDWPKIWPQNGKVNALIDDKGNWQFTGQFPGQPQLAHPNHVTITFVLSGTNKNGVGQAVAMTDEFVVDKNGGSFTKTGHDQVVEDLWPVVVAGHTHQWLTHTHPIAPAEPPPQNEAPSHSSGGSGGSSGCNSVSGAIGAFFTGGLSCL
jgi:hypothetical protein